MKTKSQILSETKY